MALPDKYHFISEDILGDIFYLDGISNRGRMTLIRQYAEVICRIILKIDGRFTLGQFKDELPKLLPNSIMKQEIIDCIQTIVDLGNAATHADKKLKDEITEEDCENALEQLNFAISYLFINYFSKYGTSEKSRSSQYCFSTSAIYKIKNFGKYVHH